MSLSGKVAMITGGGQGIGFCTARHLLEQGMAVVILEADAEAAAEAAKDLGAGQVAMVVGDVSHEADVRRAVAEAERRFRRLDALVNNAGFGIWKPIADLTLDEWNRVLAVNLTGAFLCARHAAPLLAQAGGAIVNIASTRALMSEPNGEAYGASKGGLLALTHALAVSLGPKVRVNCISPGWIDVSGLKKKSKAKQETLSDRDHAQHPAGRVGRAEDVAAMVAYLIGPQAQFISGANFVVDGGMTRKMIYE